MPLLAIVSLAGPLYSQADWPRFLGVNVDGVAPASDFKLDWQANPKLLWSLRVGDGYGIGSVAGGNYYHFDASGGSERLRCLDLQTGRQKWAQTQRLDYQDMYGYEAGPRSTATVDGDQIFTMGVGGQLTCRSQSDGELIWTVDTSKDYGVVQNFFGVGCSPLVWRNLVIVMVGGSPAADADGRLDRVSPNGSALVAFDRKTGRQRWKAGDDLASYSSPRMIDLGDESLVLLFARGGLLAVDPVSGQQRWRYDHRADMLESVNAIVPVVSGDHVFISECYQVGSVLLKVSGQGAEVVWKDPPRDRRNQAMRTHWSTPVLVDGFLYGCSGRNEPDSDFRCVEFMTGKVQWTDPRRIRASVTRAGDHLLVLEERGFFEVMKPNREQMQVVAQWSLGRGEDGRPPIEYPCWAAPVIVGDKLLLRGDETVLCLQIAKQNPP
jgi:outer membrane protein assembly factor BamB